MNIETTTTDANVTFNPVVMQAAARENPGSSIDPLTLANLDFGLFRTLRKLGTSRERVCSALCLSYAEYDFVATLGH